MHTAQEALDVVKANKSRVGSLIALFAAKQADLEAALAAVMTPEIRAAIEETFNLGTDEAMAIDAVLNANVPPPAPVPA